MQQLVDNALKAVHERYPAAAKAAQSVTTAPIEEMRAALTEIVRGNVPNSGQVGQAQQRAGIPPEQLTNWPITQLNATLGVFFDMAVGRLDAEGEAARDRLVLELTAALRVAHLIEIERAKLGAGSGGMLFIAPAGLDVSKLGARPGGRR